MFESCSNHPRTILEPSSNHPRTTFEPPSNHPRTTFEPSSNHLRTIKPESGYSLAGWVAGIRQILEQERIKEVCIVAHSNGVIFAKEYYRAYPGQVLSLLLWRDAGHFIPLQFPERLRELISQAVL